MQTPMTWSEQSEIPAKKAKLVASSRSWRTDRFLPSSLCFVESCCVSLAKIRGLGSSSSNKAIL